MDDNTKEAIYTAAKELMGKVIEANGIRSEDVACAFFTTTRDLNAAFPAAAARQLGWQEVALLCGHEMDVPQGLPRCLRVLILFNTEKRPEEIVHVYLKGAQNLKATNW